MTNIVSISSLLHAVYVIPGSYQSGAPYNVYPTGPTVPTAGQGSYIHVYQTTPSVVVIGGCPACRVCCLQHYLLSGSINLSNFHKSEPTAKKFGTCFDVTSDAEDRDMTYLLSLHLYTTELRMTRPVPQRSK